MRRLNFLILCFLNLLCVTGVAFADTKVDQQPLGPDGESLGCSISPHGGHVAVLAAKGSRFVVLLDGVAGPKIDALLTTVMGSPVMTASYWMGQVPVLFSDDGTHSAYSAKVGNEYVVMLDGKELTRGQIPANPSYNLPLTFSAGGKHLFYMDTDAANRYRVVVDGKPGPPSYVQPQLVVSTNGEHYAYVGYEHDAANSKWAVVDGRQVNFFGDNLQYNARNVLVATMNVNGATILTLNGKPEVKAYRLDPMWISQDGAQIALVITPTNGAESFLTINGKTVPETKGLIVNQVYFSPDGKRYAALVRTKANAKFMIIDGKRGEEYQEIVQQASTSASFYHWLFVNGTQPTNIASVEVLVPGFTADSSKFVYVAQQGARQFMVVEDQESNGFQNGIEPILSMTGHRIGLIGVAPNGKQHVIIDDKEQEFGPTSVPGGPSMRIRDLSFTPDGTRCAYVNGPSLCVDGANLPGVVSGAQFSFSPDDKHIVYLANDAGSYLAVFLDGKIVDKSPGNLSHPFFSPDNQHLFWLETKNLQAQGTKDSIALYVDGKQATHFSDAGAGASVNFEFTPDGVLTFVARTDENLRRFSVTPSPDGNISTMLAAAATPQGK